MEDGCREGNSGVDSGSRVKRVDRERRRGRVDESRESGAVDSQIIIRGSRLIRGRRVIRHRRRHNMRETERGKRDAVVDRVCVGRGKSKNKSRWIRERHVGYLTRQWNTRETDAFLLDYSLTSIDKEYTFKEREILLSVDRQIYSYRVRAVRASHLY